MSIKIDQILRARGVTDKIVLECSKDAYTMRVRYHKMYYHFKPGKSYWILYILARKGLIAFAGLMFRSNPGFQMAVLLFILFGAFVMQVKHQPYMSTAQRELVLMDHREKAEKGDVLHKAISDKVKRFLKKDERALKPMKSKQIRSLSRVRSQDKMSGSSRDIKAYLENSKRRYFFDYNTVEQVLLACAIFVCLAGVMFESDRFSEGGAKGALVTGRFDWQREMITYMASAVVLFGLAYYFMVFVSEVFGITPEFLMQKAHNSGRFTKFDDDDSGFELSSNPRLRDDGKTQAKLDALVAGRQELIAINQQLMADKRKGKKGGIMHANPLQSKGRAKKATNKKKEFGQTMHDDM